MILICRIAVATGLRPWSGSRGIDHGGSFALASTKRNYAKVIEEMIFGNGPDERIRPVDRKYLNNRIEADHAALKQLLRPKRNFRKLTAAKNTLKGIETHRAIKKGHFANNEPGILNEIAFVANLFDAAA